jgi:hypothetical protein
MLSITHVMVRSAKGASRTTHGGDARSCFPVCCQFFHTLAGRDPYRPWASAFAGVTRRADGICSETSRWSRLTVGFQVIEQVLEQDIFATFGLSATMFKVRQFTALGLDDPTPNFLIVGP